MAPTLRIMFVSRSWGISSNTLCAQEEPKANLHPLVKLVKRSGTKWLSERAEQVYIGEEL